MLKIVLALVVLSWGGMAAAIVFEELPPSTSANQVQLALYDFPGLQIFNLAKQKGFFGEERTNVLPTARENLANSSSQVFRLFNEFTGYQLVALPLIEALAREREYPKGAAIILGIFDLRGQPPQILFQRPQLILRPENLRGRKIGFTPKSISDYAFFFVFQQANLRREEVEDIKTDLAVRLKQYYLNNEIQAFALCPPHSWRLADELGERLEPMEQGLVPREIFNHVLVARADFISGGAENERRLRAVVHGFLKAVRYLRLHPSAGREVLLAGFAGVERDRQGEFLDAIEYLDQATNLARFAQAQEESFQKQADSFWAVLLRFARGEIADEPPVARLTDRRFLLTPREAASAGVAPPPPPATPKPSATGAASPSATPES